MDRSSKLLYGEDKYREEMDVRWVAPEGMAIRFRGRAMGGPAGVRDGALGEKGLLLVHARVRDLLAESGHFADLLEENHVAGLVTVDADACRAAHTSE
jgi:hypothetical protein